MNITTNSRFIYQLISLFLFLNIFCTIENYAQPVLEMKEGYGLYTEYVNCEFQIIDDREIRIFSQADAKNKRLEIIQAIWDEDQIPNKFNVIVSYDYDNPISLDPVINRVDKIEIPTEIPLIKGTGPIMNVAYLFVPSHRNNRLVIVHQGHACTFKDANLGDSGYRIEATIKSLLTEGYDVLAVYMPHITETDCNKNHSIIINTYLGYKKHKATYGLRLFLEPTIVSVNYLLTQNSYDDISMIGLSGGGWTTTLISAIDDRIKNSFDVAGSAPIYYRWGASYGDIEQFLPQLYRDIAGYPDLYVLASLGQGRKHTQILNRYDNCCFGELQHNPERDYISDMQTFAKSVMNRLNSLGYNEQYELVIDEIAQVHQISSFALDSVILNELKSSK